MDKNIQRQAKYVDAAQVIERRNDLFALPDAALKILELAGKDDIGLDLLSGLISKDPALTGRLLKIANSPFYGLNRKVSNIQQAVMILGLTTVKCLVLSAALFNPGKISADVGLDIKAMYSDILLVAVTCQKLAVACGYHSPEDAFTCGLLHDIGLLFYLQNFPREYRAVIGRVAESGNVVDEERKSFGISHTEAGQLIAAKWRLPDEIGSALANHHSFGFKGSETLDDIVRLAVALSMQQPCDSDDDIEEKITKLTTISSRLKITREHLHEIIANTMQDVLAFADSLNIDVGDRDTILARANQEIFRMYMSIQKLFRERQELTRQILDEERQKGIKEAKQVAISTLSHYINNASMIIFGQSQVVRLMIKEKSEQKIVGQLPQSLDVIDNAIRRIVAVLEEISELNILDDVEYFDQSKILNMDDRINERMAMLKDGKAAGLGSEMRPVQR
ncbi:MAG: HDOD domain-containing protein [Candidatus Zixiibacteriota bacterium]|nr:MAG: HDOD domain-containing protein [candidate division Zixibacteria bacterium]